MSISLTQALSEAQSRQQEERQRKLTKEQEARKRLEPVAVRIPLLLKHERLQQIGLFGTVGGIGFRFSLPSPTQDSVLVEAFEDRIVLKRGRDFGYVFPLEGMVEDDLVTAVAYLMTESFASPEDLQTLLENRTKERLQRMREAIEPPKEARNAHL